MSAALAAVLLLVAAVLVPDPTAAATRTTTSAAPTALSAPAPDAPSPSSVVQVAAVVASAEVGDDQPAAPTSDATVLRRAEGCVAVGCPWSVRPVRAGAPLTVPD